MRTPALAFALGAAVFTALPLAAQNPLSDPDLQEWEVPYDGARPRDPAVHPDGRVFFCGQGPAAYIGALDPETGEFQRFDLEGVQPHNIVIDPHGMVWYSGNAANEGSEPRHIGRLDPSTGEITRYWMPDERARDPHTLIFDSKGDIWFTVQQGNFVGKMTVATGEIRLVEAPQVPGRGGAMTTARPYGIVMDSRDRPWIALFNTNKIATVDPGSFQMRTFDLPDNARPRRIAITSDDVIWYGDWVRGTLGRLDPASGALTEFPLPGGEGSRPYAILADDSDRIWINESGVRPNTLVGFDPMTNTMFSTTRPESGAGTVRHMYFDPNTNFMWFGADAGTIGVMKLPPRRRAIS